MIRIDPLQILSEDTAPVASSSIPEGDVNGDLGPVAHPGDAIYELVAVDAGIVTVVPGRDNSQDHLSEWRVVAKAKFDAGSVYRLGRVIAKEEHGIAPGSCHREGRHIVDFHDRPSSYSVRLNGSGFIVAPLVEFILSMLERLMRVDNSDDCGD